MFNPIYRETICDNPACNTLLMGFKGVHKQQIDHLTIRGGICTQRFSHNGNPFYTWLTPKPEEGRQQEVYAFCHSKCLSGFIESREAFMQEQRQRDRVEWAREETKDFNRFDVKQ